MKVLRFGLKPLLSKQGLDHEAENFKLKKIILQLTVQDKRSNKIIITHCINTFFPPTQFYRTTEKRQQKTVRVLYMFLLCRDTLVKHLPKLAKLFIGRERRKSIICSL